MQYIKFNLTNKYIYWSLIFFSLVVLTSINNYYFFKNVLINSYRNGLQLKVILETQNTLCIKNNLSLKACQDSVVETTNAFSKKGYYNKSISIMDDIGNIIWKKDASRNYPASSIIEIYVKNLNDQISVIVEIKSNFDISEFIYSIFNSMSFSILDVSKIIYTDGIQDAIDAFVNHYWARSRPFFGFLVFTLTLFGISRFREKTFIQKQDELEKEIIKTFQENEVLRLQQNNTSEDAYETLLKKMKSFDAHINPPINTFNIDILFLDLHSLANKCRQIAEKLVFSRHKKYFKDKPKNLFEGIQSLKNKKLISYEMHSNLEIIRAYGNRCSHYNDKDLAMTRSEGIALCACLIAILEEFYNDLILIEGDSFDDTTPDKNFKSKVQMLLKKFRIK